MKRKTSLNREGADTMASCKFQGGKYHSKTEAKAHLRHDDISVENRKIAAKGNPNIDISKSHLNRSLCGLTYREACEKYDKRIEFLDNTTNTNRRKDRVTLQNIEVPVPADLEREKYNRWFVRVAEILCSMYGQLNFVDGQIHYDEEHQYISAENGELVMSRVHAHYSIVPEINGILNCKKMSGRANMRKLNKAVEDMTQTEFGCSFMTGEKKKSKQTIDELKNISNHLALEQRENALIENENEVSRREQAVEQKEANLSLYERLGVEYYNRAKLLFNNLSLEDEGFKKSKAKLYNQSLQSIDELHIKIDESLLPQTRKQREKQKSL